MQDTSALYNEIISGDNYWFEVALAIGESGRLITEHNEVLYFGNTAILVDSGGASTAFREDILMSLSTTHRVFNEDYPVVGSAIAGEIDISMLEPTAPIPKRARLVPFVRATDGVRYSEWLQKGTYYVDTRETTHNSNGLDIVTIHGYDAMLMFEQNYPSDSEHDYPLLDVTMVQFLADSIKISVDPRTFERMDKGYTFSLPVGYSSREVLGMIAASYGGNFVMSDEGQLLLIRLGDLPKETNYLTSQIGDILLFGTGEHTQTYSGSIVTFEGYGNPVDSLKLTINPVQDLHGYENPWPAGGGKNIVSDGTDTNNGYKSGYYIGARGTTVAASADRVTEYFEVEAETDYTWSGVPTSWNSPGICFYDQNKDYISGIAYAKRASYTFTTPSGAKYARASDQMTPCVMIVLGSIASAFEPYSNICPITGHTGVNVTRTGKNLIKALYTGRTNKDVTYTVNVDGTISLSGTATASSYAAPNLANDTSKMLLIKAGQYTLSGGISSAIRLYFGGKYVDGTALVGIGYDTGNGLTYTFSKDAWIYPQIVVANGTNTDGVTVQPMLVRGSAKEDFAPYVGTTYPVTWQSEAGTVYGGTLDVLTGLLTVDRAMIVFNGSQSISLVDWRPTGSGVGWVYPYSLTNHKIERSDSYIPKVISDSLPTLTYAAAFSGVSAGVSAVASTGTTSYGLVIRTADASLTTESAINNYLSANPIQVCYELATPLTYQLTPAELTTLLGQNNIWHDANGDTEVVYKYGGEPTRILV